jgi:hypothetical protein
MEEVICRICLEPMSNPPEERVSGGCNEHKIAATIPCGHFFHHICILNWIRKGCSTTKLCPQCNIPFQGCVGLYMDPSMFRGDTILDDDVSLSSVEESERTLEEEGEDGDDTNEIIDGGVKNQAQSIKSGDQVNQNTRRNASTDVIDLCESFGEESVVLLTRPVANDSSCYASLPGSTSQTAALNYPSVGTMRKSSPASSRNSEKENDEIRRITKIAKFYKLQHKQGELKIKRLQEDVSALSDHLGEKVTSIERLIADGADLKKKVARVESQLDRNRHQLVGLTKDRDSLLNRNSLLENENDVLKSHMKELKHRYEKDLEDARGESMPEFRQMTRKIRELEELQRLVNLVPQRPTVNTNSHAKGTRASSNVVREFSQNEQAMKRTATRRTSPLLRTSEKAESTAKRKIDVARYSSNAARMVLSSSRQKEKKYLREANNVVMEQLSKESPRIQIQAFKATITRRRDFATKISRPANRPIPRSLGGL